MKKVEKSKIFIINLNLIIKIILKNILKQNKSKLKLNNLIKIKHMK